MKSLGNPYIRKEETKFTIFKIIPHTSNQNSNTRKLMASLYELFSYRYPKYPWQRGTATNIFKKDNLYIQLKEKPKFWWFIKMRGSLPPDYDFEIEKLLAKQQSEVAQTQLPPPTEEPEIIDNIEQNLETDWFSDSTNKQSSSSTDLSWVDEDWEIVDAKTQSNSEPDPVFKELLEFDNVLTAIEEEPVAETYEDYKKQVQIKEYIQQIEYYIAVPTEFKEAFKTKFYNHEQWKRATLEEVEENPIEFDDVENTDVYNLGYTRNDIFSLKYDYAQQTSPNRDILGVSRELRDNEQVYLFLESETVPRKKWKRLADYAWGVWDKGRVPSRPGINGAMIVSDIVGLATSSVNYVYTVLQDVVRGVGEAFIEFDDKDEVKKIETKNLEREALLVDGDVARHSKEKRYRPTFKTKMMYTVTSPDKVRRDMISRSMENSFADLKGNNELKARKMRVKSEKTILDLKNFKTPLTMANTMSVDELGKIQQLPTADVQREFSESLVSNKRIENKISEELTDSSGILAGTTISKGETKEVHIQTKNNDMTSTARVFIGSPRMGKDQAVINLIVESKLKHDRGAVVIDVINERKGHRGMADALRDHLPESEIIDLNIMDTNNPIYMGLESIVRLNSDSRTSSDRIAEEITNYLLSDGDQDKLRTVEYLRDAAKFTNADILGIKHMFTSEVYRNKILKEKGHLFDTDIWEQYNNMSMREQEGIYLPIMRRIGQITSSEFLKPIFCQLPNNKLDLFTLIEEGKVIVFRMKTGIMSERVIEMISYWITLVTFLIKLSQDGAEEKSKGSFLVLNEPHQYLTPNLAGLLERILAEGPKYRLVPILIFHNFKQFKKHPGFVDVLKSSSLNWHIFKNTNEDVYKDLYQGYLSKTFESHVEAFEATQAFQYIGVWLNSEGDYYDPFVADALPLVTKRYETLDNSHLTEEHSKKYGRPIQEVLDEIKERNKQAPVVYKKKATSR